MIVQNQCENSKNITFAARLSAKTCLIFGVKRDLSGILTCRTLVPDTSYSGPKRVVIGIRTRHDRDPNVSRKGPEYGTPGTGAQHVLHRDTARYGVEYKLEINRR